MIEGRALRVIRGSLGIVDKDFRRFSFCVATNAHVATTLSRKYGASLGITLVGGGGKGVLVEKGTDEVERDQRVVFYVFAACFHTTRSATVSGLVLGRSAEETSVSVSVLLARYSLP